MAPTPLVISSVVYPHGDGFSKFVAYGAKKAKLSILQTFISGIMAGWWLGVAGHVSTLVAGSFNVGEPWSPGVSRVIYGTMFPVGFVAVVWTACELYTGNTAAMVVYVAEKPRDSSRWVALAKNWGGSLIGNFAGTFIAAGLLSYFSDAFAVTAVGPHRQLCGYSEHKVSQSWGAVFMNAIGCNALVCLATWTSVLTQDGAGKYFCIWICISAFCMGGFEHIIANFYTLFLGMLHCQDIFIADIFTKNWIPVLLGNTFAGAIICGLSWVYLLRPRACGVSWHLDMKQSSETPPTMHAGVRDDHQLLAPMV